MSLCLLLTTVAVYTGIYKSVCQFLFLSFQWLGVVVSQDENEEITDDHDVEDELDNDADDLDDVDDGLDVSEHLVTEDSEEEAKENKTTKVRCFKKKSVHHARKM